MARSFLRFVSALSGNAGGVCAEYAFRHPPRFPPTRREREILERGGRSFVRGPQGEIAVWHWGSGPRVLLAHGWGSHAGRLAPFVDRLLAAGFGVAAFDAPGHGASAGRFASLPEFVDAVERVARSVSPVAFVGHSLGAAACALALRRGVPARAAVLISTPADPSLFTRRYVRWMKLPPEAARAMCRRLEHRYGAPLDTYSLLPRDPAVPALLIHDRGDLRIPIADGRALASAWKHARLLETRGLGHHRILRDPVVLRRAERFLTEQVLAPALPRRTARLVLSHAS
jgi:pimeloyl-ACP methyl ester carboxylesterase